MSHQLKTGLSFDDVLLEPVYSTIKSRSDVNLNVSIKKKGFETTLKHPLIPANMKSIFEYEMAEAVYLAVGLGFIHRFMPWVDQLNILEALHFKYGKEIYQHIGLSVGIQDLDKVNIENSINKGIKIFCLDVAHCDSLGGIEMTQWISQRYPNVLLVAGNIVSGEGARRLWNAGADFVKVGIGSGSICSTRINTGNGVPQITALMEVAEVRQQMEQLMLTRPQEEKRSFGIISDGGAKSSGDLVKALCLSDLVMSGNLFAGCRQTPGHIQTIDGQDYKDYVGSSTHKAKHIEGVKALVKVRGNFKDTLDELLQGIRSGCSYQNARNVKELQDSSTFIQITQAGLVESHAHDVSIIQ
jgi:IMP dehydrogenase